MGYYSGTGGRYITTVQPSAQLPQAQPACLTDSSTRLYDCGNWGVSASWTVPTNAVSGIYIAAPVRDDTGGASHIIFVVRNDTSHSAILFQTSDLTWQAYNGYGGNSVYGPTEAWDLTQRAYKVSYNRPSDTRTFGSESATWVFGEEYPMVRWLESNGYDVSYFTGVDAARNGSLIKNHQLYLDVGHDEYWSGPQRTNVEAARDSGVNMAFFSGNEVFWKTRWENSIDGTNTPYRTMVVYKETLGPNSQPVATAAVDPADPPTWTGTWRDPAKSPPADGGRPENSLTGTIFMVNGPGTDNPGTLSIQVPAEYSQMRFWRNTSIQNLASGKTATLPAGTLGYEWDEDIDNGSRPAGTFDLSSTTVNLTNDLLLDEGGIYGAGTAIHQMTEYRAPSGALVFGAGTVQWAWGLDNNHDNPFGSNLPADPDMQQAAANLLADMGVLPATLRPGLAIPSKSTDTNPPISTITSPKSGATLQYGIPVTVAGIATDAGGGVVAGVEVSGDGGQTWHRATGRTSWSYSWTPLTAGSVTVLSRAVDDSANLEVPSPGVDVTVPSPPIATDAAVSTDGVSASTTIQSPSFSTNVANELLLAFVTADYLSGANTTITSVTGGGLTWALVVRSNGQSGDSEIWRAFATSPISAATVTATLSQSVVSSITIRSFEGVNASGTNGSGAIGATASMNARTGAPSASVTTTQNASWVYGVGNDFDNATPRTPGTGQSLVHQYLTATGDTYWVQKQNGPTYSAGTVVRINDTAPTTDRWNLAVVEILPSPSGIFSISGSISPTAAGAGASVLLTGAVTATVTANASGNFTFAGLPNGSYVVTPSQAGYVFTPSSTSITLSGTSATGVNFTGAQAFSISGTITPAMSGVLVTLSGASSKSTTTDGSGNYSFPNLVNGSYTITPSNAGFSFSPPSQSVTVNGSNMSGINFTAAATSFSISGNLSSLGANATVTLSGAASKSTAADASGNYSFATLANGSYTITPTKSGYTFTPVSQNVSVNGANVSGVNFSAQALAPTWTISGNVSTNGANSSIALSGTASARTTADSSGNYGFAGLANGSYTITPTKSGYTFSPVSQQVTVNGANISGVNFTATQNVSSGLAIDAKISKDTTTTATTIASTAFSTSAGNELLLAFISADYLSGANTTVTSIASTGLTWTLVVRTNTQSGTAEIWRAFASSPLTNVTVTATLSQKVLASMTVMSFAGVDTTGTNGSGAIGNTASSSAKTGAPTASLVTTRNNSWVFSVGDDYDNAVARTPGANQTIAHQDLTSTGDTYWVQMQNSPTLLSGTNVTINDTAPTTDRYNLSVVEVRTP
jgi:Bacterial Ig domain